MLIPTPWPACSSRAPLADQIAPITRIHLYSFCPQILWRLSNEQDLMGGAGLPLQSDCPFTRCQNCPTA